MSRYLLIESRDPFETREVEQDYQLAADLANQGQDTTLFLIQNGVMSARGAAKDSMLNSLLNQGVKIVCDEFSLRERGIYSRALLQGVEIGPLDIVLEHLAEKSKTLWL